MKTLKELAELVHEQESEQAPGSETILLGDFVQTYGTVSSIIDGDSDKAGDLVTDDVFEAWERAYSLMAQYEADGIEYDGSMLF